MDLFPLYDQVVAKLDKTETALTNKYCSTITRLSQEHINIIYLIILHHYQLKNKGNDFNIPFNAKVGSKGKGVTFKLNRLNEDLQNIIVRYLIIISAE